MAKFKKVDEALKEELKDPYFKELWELEEQKLAMVKPIIAYRIKHKLTQRQLAKKVNVTQQHISNIEKGEFSSVVTLEKVLLYIGFKVEMKVVPLSPAVRKKLSKSLNKSCRS